MVTGPPAELGEGFIGGESGGRVVEEETDSSRSGSSSWESWRFSEEVSALSPCFDNIFWVMRLWEKGVLWGRGVVEYSSTVDRTAVVISSRDVYGKQMLRIALRLVG